MKLLFIRHAESIGNLEKRMQGWADFELSSQGKLQVKKLARQLLIEAWWPDYVYSSPLKRAAQTTQALITEFETAPARSIRGEAKIDVKYVDELKELHNGIFQGLTWLEAQTRYPELCHRLETSPEWIAIPGAESLQQARDRASQLIQTLLTRHTNSDQIWIVTHGGILQYLIAELLGCDGGAAPKEHRTWGLQIHATALFEFWIDLTRWHLADQNRFNTALWQIRRFNDSQHLLPQLS